MHGVATDSGKMILGEYIDRGKGANCNVIRTQPRRLVAIRVADRAAKERGEGLGKSIGCHVRFEAKSPEPDSSATLCVIGFLEATTVGAVGRSERPVVARQSYARRC